MRTLTLLVDIEDIEDSAWLWLSLESGLRFNGVQVFYVGDGDQITNLENDKG